MADEDIVSAAADVTTIAADFDDSVQAATSYSRARLPRRTNL